MAAIPYTDEWYDKDTMNWEDLPASTVAGLRIASLDISLDAPNTLFYGTTAGRVFRLDSLERPRPCAPTSPRPAGCGTGSM